MPLHDTRVPMAFEHLCLIGLEQALQLGAAPDLVARGMVGLDRPESHDFRRCLAAMGASPFALALSVVDCHSERANFLRAKIAAEHRDPSSAALGLAGCARETLRSFCRTLIRQGADEEWAALGLAGCEDEWSFELRTMIGVRAESQFSRPCLAQQRIALGLAGCDGVMAHAQRDALHCRGIFLFGTTAESLRGCSSDTAHVRRQAWLTGSPVEVAWSLVGQEMPRDHALRHRLLEILDHPGLVLRSLAGCDGSAAWALRERLAKAGHVSVHDIAASLARCTSDRACSFREKLLMEAVLSPEDMVESLVGIHDPHRAFWPWARPRTLYAIS